MKKIIKFMPILCLGVLSLASCNTGDQKVTITFDANEGVFEDGKDIYKLEVDKGIRWLDVKKPEVSKKDYNFVGWTDIKNVDSQIEPSKIINENITVYAYFQEILEYQVTYMPEGGHVHGETEEAKPETHIEYKNTGIADFDDPYEGKTVEKGNTVIDGWSLESDPAKRLPVSSDWKLKSDTILYPIYTQGEHLVVFNDESQTLNIDCTSIKMGDKLEAHITVDNTKIIENYDLYEVPQSHYYYEVKIDGEPYDDYEVTYTNPDTNDYFKEVTFTIPSEDIDGEIEITAKQGAFFHYLTLSSNQDCQFYFSSLVSSPEIKYSTDLVTWETAYSGQYSKITLNANQPLYLYNAKKYGHAEKITISNPTSSLEIYADGNINSLVNWGELYDGCFKNLFCETQYLVTAPVLPAEHLEKECYNYLFGATSSSKGNKLIKAPEIPAYDFVSDNLSTSSCQYMFRYCANLTTAPSELRFKEVPNGTFSYMFQGCSKLETAPTFNPTELLNNPSLKSAAGAFSYMFRDCKKLKYNIPKRLLPKTLAYASYQGMFYNCELIEEAPEIDAEDYYDGASYSCASMFYQCKGLKKAPSILKLKTLRANVYSGMFQNCYALENLPIIEGDTFLSGNDSIYACQKMFYSDKDDVLKITDQEGGTSFFTCPSTEGANNPVIDMFSGRCDSSTPTDGVTYYF